MLATTYTLKRKCQHCGQAIPDQAHAVQKYCRRERLTDGTVRSCKDDFHSARKRKDETQFRNIARYHRNVARSLDQLYKLKGEDITPEDLNRVGVVLNRSAAQQMTNDNRFQFFFVGFVIIKINEKQLKLKKHDHQF
jgi:hypothetical protein